MTYINLILFMFACNRDVKDSAASSDTNLSDNTQTEISDCGQQVLEEGTPTAFSDCFDGDETYGACETCGYYPDVGLSQGDFDCITCPSGFEIDVYFGDCTGYCVPEGTAALDIASSGCVPVSECVLE